ncbi:toprim domain-containing protein [Acidiferrobacter thiooxydans]|uniref:toprim domain-containing protein n=1 Tax=Acidiferrobacter thiooxydans TaxID=163359 RepID=UPI001146EBF9|nr:toprim domain-containing protein [Acidiferrobacter thiooxydans]UEO01097.1 toprim domain-containing protein [Acidiferrobacter thiooxydans]
MSAPLENLLARLDKVRQSGSEWQALCPAHDDRNPSLSIKEGDDGVLLVKCHIGCSARDIVGAVGLTLGDLFPDHLRKGRRGATGQPDPEASARIAKAKAARQEKKAKELTERVQDAHNSWSHSPAPLAADSIAPGHDWARAYLRSRGPGVLEVAIAAGVRVLPTTSKSSYNPNTKRRAPCILWPIRDPRSGNLVGAQREWGRGHKNKRMQGRHIVPMGGADPRAMHSGYVRFPGRRDTLYVCEGQITAAAVAAATGERVVALFDTAGISQPPRPVIQRAVRDGATRIIVAGDVDKMGVKKALEGIHIIQTWGLKVPIVWTVPPEGQDWADILEREGPDAVRAALVAGERPISAPEVSAVASAAATVWSIQPWRPASEPVLPCAAVPVEQARIILKHGVQAMVEDYISWLAQIDERKEQKQKGRLPTARPWLFRPTTGTGKTTELKALINNAEIRKAGGAVLALVPAHDQAKAYEEAGWWHYYGRSPDPECPGYCPNHQALMEAVEAHHIPQAEFCHRCPNGLKWAEKWDDLAQMGYTGEKLAELETCVWQQHLRDTMQAQFVVAPIASFSETLAGWAKDGLDASGDKPMRRRLVVADEHVQMSVPVEVGLPDIDLWARRTSDTMRALETAQARADAVSQVVGDSQFEAIKKAHDERREQITALRAALDLFKTLGAEMGRLVGKEGRITVAPALLDAVQRVLEVDDEDVAAWERLEFNRDGTLKLTPLRAAWAIRKTLEFGDGYVKDGVLTVAGVRPIIDRIGKRPIAFFDATPDQVTVDAVTAHGGQVIDAIAVQHVRIIRKPQRSWGLTPFNPEFATEDRREREVRRYKALRALHPEAALLVHKKAHTAIDPDNKDVTIGHWGAHHRSHDEWANFDEIVMVGSFFPPMHAWRKQYQASRVAALSVGADPARWPEWPDDAKTEDAAWGCEGTHAVQSKHPLPTDPSIRAWLLGLSTAESVQAIGRARGANRDPAKPTTIHMYGGLPLEGLGAYGMTVDSYEADDPALGASRPGKAMDARQVIAAAQDAGQRTINGIREWVKRRFGLVVGVDRVRSVIRSLEASARASGDDIEQVFRAVARRADAYLHQAHDNIENAIDRAVAANDWPAAELLDIPSQARARPPATAGPPSAA